MYACDGGSYRMVELLLDKGADPNDAAKVHKIMKAIAFRLIISFPE